MNLKLTSVAWADCLTDQVRRWFHSNKWHMTHPRDLIYISFLQHITYMLLLSYII